MEIETLEEFNHLKKKRKKIFSIVLTINKDSD